jgi:excisionase family DNA binding protein
MLLTVMTVAEVCEFLRINRSTLYRLIKERQIPSFRVGSEHRFSRAAIDAWQRAQEAKSAPPSFSRYR